MTVTSSPFLEELAGYDALARRAALGYLRADGVSHYLRAPAAEYLERGGKGLRPALCLATCTAFGGEVEDALPSAAAIELMHTAFLVHDDVEDDSDLREASPPCTASTVGHWPSMLVTVWPSSLSGAPRQPKPARPPPQRSDLVRVRLHGSADSRRTGAGTGMAARRSYRSHSG